MFESLYQKVLLWMIGARVVVVNATFIDGDLWCDPDDINIIKNNTFRKTAVVTPNVTYGGNNG
jgi:hypothetical protein